MNVTLGKFNTTMNFITGFSSLPEDFDIENNPFIKVLGYEIISSSSGNFMIEGKYSFYKCDQDYLDGLLE